MDRHHDSAVTECGRSGLKACQRSSVFSAAGGTVRCSLHPVARGLSQAREIMKARSSSKLSMCSGMSLCLTMAIDVQPLSTSCPANRALRRLTESA
eukprot:6484708-Amphidinium_carterae.2